jgi:2'-5' RNA ligase
MQFHPGEAGRLNCFAAVAYIPGPLGSFVERLRQELVPSCKLRSHVTILPPRRISVSPEQAREWMCEQVRRHPAFTIRVAGVEVFPLTSVVHLSVDSGREQLLEIHSMLNQEVLACEEPFAYQPHITLAQEISPDSVPEISAIARRRWVEYASEREFLIDKIAFVQNTIDNQWLDLAECLLAPPAR